MGARSDVVVIGAGHNGLVAAALLAKDGRRVTVLERAAEVGGILRGGEFGSGLHGPRARAHGRPSPSIGDRGPATGGPRALAHHAARPDVRAPARRVFGDVLGRCRPDGAGAPGAEPARCGRLRGVRSEDASGGVVPRLRERRHPTRHQRADPRRRDLRAQDGVGVPRPRGAVRARGDPHDADGRRGSRPGGFRGGGRAWPAVHSRRALHGMRTVVGGDGRGVPERLRRQRRRGRGDRRRSRAGGRRRSRPRSPRPHREPVRRSARVRR